MQFKTISSEHEFSTDPLAGLSLALFDEARVSVRAFVKSAGIDRAATDAFGPGVSGAVTAAVRGFERDGWPKLVLLDQQELHGARGAYDQASDTIYLSRDYLAASHGAPESI